jgi:hypothetical protein
MTRRIGADADRIRARTAARVGAGIDIGFC